MPKKGEAVRRIEKLTPEQAARIPEFRDRWLQLGLAIGPADRRGAEAAADEAYRAAGLEPPRLKIWLQSPMAGAIGAALLARGIVRAQVGAQVRDQVRDQVWAQVGDQVGAQVRDQVWDQVWDQVGDQVWDQVGAQVRDQVGAQVRDQVGDQVRDQVGAQVRDQVGDQIGRAGYGQHDAGWLAFYDFFRDVTGLQCAERLGGLWGLAATSGWFWPFHGAVILTERPRLLKRDDRFRLHAESGPALLYPDGWGIHAWHGTRVPADWIEKKSELDPATALTWQNIEQRRAAAEIIGWRRVLEHLKPKTIDADKDPEIGTLLEVDLPDSPGQRFLRVRCGTGRDFVLPVPREMRSALQANAWTYGLEAPQLQLEVRT